MCSGTRLLNTSADAHVRKNIFPADENSVRARIGNGTADVGITQQILISVFQCLEARLKTLFA
jgi:hypothetical protein